MERVNSSQSNASNSTTNTNMEIDSSQYSTIPVLSDSSGSSHPNANQPTHTSSSSSGSNRNSTNININNNYTTTNQTNQNVLNTSNNNTNPFIRNPLGNMTAPCGKYGPVCARQSIYSMIYVQIVVLGITSLYVAFVPPSTEIWSRVIVGIMGVSASVLTFLSSSRDPGVVLPARIGDEEARDQDVIIDGDPVTLHVCPTCKVLRPYRSAHCGVTDVCLLENDHFCGVTGATVAARTMRFFTLFMYIVTTVAGFIFIRSIVVLATESASIDTSTSYGSARIGACWACIIVTALGACCSCPAAVSYSEHVGRGSTIRDRSHLRHKYAKREPTCGRWAENLFGCDNYPDSALELMTDDDWKRLV